MMDNFLESKGIKVLVIVVGILSGTAGLVAYAFPDQRVVGIFSLGGIIIVIIYFLYVYFHRVFLRSDRRTTYIYTSRRYGVGYESLHIECIIDDDGSALVKRIANVESFSGINHLDTFLMIPEDHSNSHRDPIKYGSVTSLTNGREVSLIQRENQIGRFSAEIEIDPPLSESQKVSYEMIEKLPNGLYAINLSQDELSKRKTSYDYFGWSINKPIKKLSLAVYFPPNFEKPQDTGIEVRFAATGNFPTERLHHKEQDRLNEPQISGPDGGRYVLKLDVEDPVLGLIYVLRWTPLQGNSF